MQEIFSIMEANTLIRVVLPQRLRKGLIAYHITGLLVDPVYLVVARYVLLLYWQNQLLWRKMRRGSRKSWKRPFGANTYSN